MTKEKMAHYKLFGKISGVKFGFGEGENNDIGLTIFLKFGSKESWNYHSEFFSKYIHNDTRLFLEKTNTDSITDLIGIPVAVICDNPNDPFKVTFWRILDECL